MERESAVARLAYLAAPGHIERMPEFIRANMPEPLPVEVAYEIVLQSYLFFGYPQAIEALRTFMQTVKEMGLTLARMPDENDSLERIRKRGEELCGRIYHPNYEQLIENMSTISRELADWMVTEGYGRVLSRPGPQQLEREIASIVFLTCSNHPVQLFSHVRGARNLGADPDRLRQALSAAGLTDKQQELADSTIERVFER
jgi:alkylhydroperoxidase/carboxymuconolactone decarboxylase family protein YurZ